MGTVFFTASEAEVKAVSSFDDFIPLFERMPFSADASSLQSVEVLLEILLGDSEGAFLPSPSPIQPPEYIYQLELEVCKALAVLDDNFLMKQSVTWAEKGFFEPNVNPFDCAGMMVGIQGACKLALEQNRPLYIFVDED